MKILAMAASNSSTSINHRVILHATDVITGGLIPGATVQVLDLNDFALHTRTSMTGPRGWTCGFSRTRRW